jgi:homoserine kinase
MITVRVPATSANLGPGFDSIGLALDFWNEVSVARSSLPQIAISGEGEGRLATDAANLAYRAVRVVADLAGERGAFRLVLRNRIPLARGLGSSSAAIVGGLYAADRLLGSRLSTERLITLAAELEGHPDNVAAALLGGLVIACQTSAGVTWARLDAPRWPVVIGVPAEESPTRAARDRLPAKVSRADAVANLSRCALLVAAVATGRHELLREAMSDRLHEPYRRDSVPGYHAVREAALAAGAWGVALSGAGPSILAFGPADAIAAAMREAYRSARVEARVLALAPSGTGTHLAPAASPGAGGPHDG